MDSKATLTVTEIAPRVWQLNESDYVDAYLIAGDSRAVLVDALMNDFEPTLAATVRSLTDKPVDVLITHIHPDHAGAAVQSLSDAGFTIYAHADDLPLLAEFGSNLDPKLFQPLSDGQLFDLGGVTLETLVVPGHTAGSVLFLDRQNCRMYSGDTVGSYGIWMQLPHSRPLSEYVNHLKRVEGEITQDWLIYPGHRAQSPQQLTGIYVSNLRELAEMIVSGEMSGDVVPINPPFYNENSRIACYGMVGGGDNGLIYDITNI